MDGFKKMEIPNTMSGKTYGKRAKQSVVQATLLDVTNTFPVIPAINSPTLTPSRSGKRKIEIEDQFKGAENDNRMKPLRLGRSYSVTGAEQPEQSAPLDVCPARHTKAKRPNSLEDIIKSGSPDDIRLLVDRVNASNRSLGLLAQQNRLIISDNGASNPQRWLRWLRAIGFEERLLGSSIVYEISADRMTELKRILSQTEHWEMSTPSFTMASAASTRHRARSQDYGPTGVRATPKIVTDFSVIRATPDHHHRVPTPSAMLSDAFLEMTLRGETPKSALTHGASSGPSPLMAAEGYNPSPSLHGLSSDSADVMVSAPSTFLSCQHEYDDHNEEVHTLLVFNSHSNISDPIYGRDACSSASLLVHSADDLARTASYGPISPPGAQSDGRSAHSSSVPTNPDVLFMSTIAGAFNQQYSRESSERNEALSRKRVITRNRRSISAPAQPTAVALSPTRFTVSQSECIRPLSECLTPTYDFESTEGATTDFIDKFKCDTVEGSTKRPLLRNFGSSEFIPVLILPDEDESTVEKPRLSRSYKTCPAALSSGTYLDNSSISSTKRLSDNTRSNDLVRSVSIHDSSPIIGYHEKMFVIPESGEESADESCMLSARSNRLSSMKKERLSNSKRYRMSGAFQMNSCAGFGVPSSSRGNNLSTRRRRRSSIFSMKGSSRALAAIERKSTAIFSGSDTGELVNPLSEENFFPVVIGGVYHQIFRLGRPFVEDSMMTFPRVVSIDFPMLTDSPDQFPLTRFRRWYGHFKASSKFDVFKSNGDIMHLNVMCPASPGLEKHIDLGAAWVVVPAYPAGVLVVSTRYFYPEDKRRICFFISEQFLRTELQCFSAEVMFANDSSKVDTNAFTSVINVVDLNVSGATELTETDGLGSEMDIADINFEALDNSLNSSSDGNQSLHQSHHHLMSLISGAHDGSPAVSINENCGPSPPRKGATPRHQNRHPGLKAPAERSYSLTAKGNNYFAQLFSEPISPFFGCDRGDLKNSGDALNLVFSFLEEEKTSSNSSRPLRSRLKSGATSSDEPVGYNAVKLVNRHWALQFYRYKASQWSVACFDNLSHRLLNDQYSRWCEFVNSYSSGSEVGCGGAKIVYRLQKKTNDRSSSLIQRPSPFIHAVAVMNVANVWPHAVQQELVVSTACSSLVRLNICPNVVQIYSSFQSPFPPPHDFWLRSSSQPALSNMVPGHYQYIAMEMCCGGDLEGYISRQRRKCLNPFDIRNMFFQMCFSLYCCREQLSLRHFDVKLLNFLLTDAASLFNGKLASSPRYDKVALRIGFGDKTFSVPLSVGSTTPGLVKLADFGTSLLGNDHARTPITAEQFTTIENTAPEFLFLGSRTTSSSFASDTFGLGLSFLHLVTGHAPYEELLKQVRCPNALEQRLSSLWCLDDPTSPYYVIKQVQDSLVFCDQDDDCSVRSVLYDTLYRYVVLLGLPSEDLFQGSLANDPSSTERNPVVSAIIETLGHTMNHCADPSIASAAKQYQSDSATWSIARGSQSMIKSARQKLSEISSDAEHWLHRMLSYDPVNRPLMFELLTSSMFELLLEDDSAANRCRPRDIFSRSQASAPATFTSSYMYYAHSELEGGTRTLAMF